MNRLTRFEELQKWQRRTFGISWECWLAEIADFRRYWQVSLEATETMGVCWSVKLDGRHIAWLHTPGEAQTWLNAFALGYAAAMHAAGRPCDLDASAPRAGRKPSKQVEGDTL